MDSQVAILTPTFNRIPQLKELFESIKAQTYTEFTWLICNDGSDVALDEWNFLYEDPRVTLVHKKHTGVADTRRVALSLIRAEDSYIIEIDDHDLMVPTCVERIVKTFKEFNADVVYGDHGVINGAPELRIKKPEYYTGLFKKEGNYAMGIRAYRLAAARLVGGYRLEDEYAEDYSLFLRLEIAEYKFVKAQGLLGYVRIDGDSISVKFYPEQIKVSNRCRELAMKGVL